MVLVLGNTKERRVFLLYFSHLFVPLVLRTEGTLARK